MRIVEAQPLEVRADALLDEIGSLVKTTERPYIEAWAGLASH
jgi:hypothetical protein